MLKRLKLKAWSRLVDICDNRKGETLRKWIPHTGLNGKIFSKKVELGN